MQSSTDAYNTADTLSALGSASDHQYVLYLSAGSLMQERLHLVLISSAHCRSTELMREWLETPVPFVALMGQDDMHKAVIDSVSPAALSFVSLPVSHVFPKKKTKRHSYEGTVQISAAIDVRVGYDPEGILKANWAIKHRRWYVLVFLVRSLCSLFPLWMQGSICGGSVSRMGRQSRLGAARGCLAVCAGGHQGTDSPAWQQLARGESPGLAEHESTQCQVTLVPVLFLSLTIRPARCDSPVVLLSQRPRGARTSSTACHCPLKICKRRFALSMSHITCLSLGLPLVSLLPGPHLSPRSASDCGR